MHRLILPLCVAVAILTLYKTTLVPVAEKIQAALTVHEAEDAAGRPVNQR